jgi:EPS-associated MarR family transcriptional regulator
LSLTYPLQELAGFQGEIHFGFLRRLCQPPQIRKSALATDQGMGLGKINSCLQAFVEKNLVKVQKFSQGENKLRNAYVLTSLGVTEKSKMKSKFSRWKVAEYGTLEAEIKAFRAEMNSVKGGPR